MNRRGFTIIELITTFSLSAVIIFFLINIVLLIKSSYFDNNIKTELLIKQSELYNYIYKTLGSDSFTINDDCSNVNSNPGLQCVWLNETHKLELIDENTIKFDDFVYKMIDGIKLDSKITIKKEIISGEEIINLKISIITDYYPNYDFGLNLISVKEVS